MLSHQDITILRELSARYAQIAALPTQTQRREAWCALHALTPERPMVLIDQVCWNEMEVDDSLRQRVDDPYWGNVELGLRRALYQAAHMPVDRVMLPYVCLPRPVRSTGWGVETVMDTLSMDSTSDVRSQHYHDQMRSLEDIQRLHFPEITVDTAYEAEIRAQADRILDGILPYRMTGQCMHLGLWDTISFWRGVENCYMDLMDQPELLHALMEKLTQGTLYQIETMNRLGLFDVHTHLCHCSHTFADEKEDAGIAPISQNAWAFGMAQLFSSVSPAVTEEFEIAYMRRIFPSFGAIYYGCCERLDDRLEWIGTLPRVRKISCSPWSRKERFAADMPANCIMSNKPSPAFLASPSFDGETVRRDLRETIDIARSHGRPLEFLLKDISTVRYEPQRLWRWAEIAMEEVTR
ncbi:MAG: hypothetical protein RR482_06845 [Clostridia bacterium]